MMIARKDMDVGQMLPPVQKDVTFENIRLFSMWSNRKHPYGLGDCHQGWVAGPHRPGPDVACLSG